MNLNNQNLPKRVTIHTITPNASSTPKIGVSRICKPTKLPALTTGCLALTHCFFSLSSMYTRILDMSDGSHPVSKVVSTKVYHVQEVIFVVRNNPTFALNPSHISYSTSRSDLDVQCRIPNIWVWLHKLNGEYYTHQQLPKSLVLRACNFDPYPYRTNQYISTMFPCFVAFCCLKFRSICWFESPFLLQLSQFYQSLHWSFRDNLQETSIFDAENAWFPVSMFPLTNPLHQQFQDPQWFNEGTLTRTSSLAFRIISSLISAELCRLWPPGDVGHWKCLKRCVLDIIIIVITIITTYH